MAYQITGGIISSPVKVVLYGTEGIGKSTFASKFPDPVFIDTEGSTDRLDVKRFPRPTSWQMLMDMVNDVRTGSVPCGTLVIDTADWAEKLCISQICSRAKADGIEGFGYGKGYTYLKEEFGKLLDLLEEVKNAGHNVLLTAHAAISKFELPDEMGSYDRWAMKTSKQVAPLIREWCDMLLFANYRTVVVKEGDGKNAKSKAQGGQERVLYTEHHACWDAKNRFGLPSCIPFDYSSIGHCIWAPNTAPITPQEAIVQHAVSVGIPVTETGKPDRDTVTALVENGVPAALADLMAANDVTELELQHVVAARGYFPEDMPVERYPEDFVNGCLIAAWPNVLDMVLEFRDIPF